MNEFILTEKQILTSLRLSGVQKLILTKIIGAANPKVAKEQISNGRNLVANRDILKKLGLIDVEEDQVSVTEKGTKVMKDENLIDDSNELTSDGQQFAAANDADELDNIKPGGNADPNASTKPAGDDLGLGDAPQSPADDLKLGDDKKTQNPFEQDISMLRKINQELRETKLLENMNRLRFSPEEMKKIKDESGDIPYDLMDKLYEFVVNYDPNWMPYGTQKARDGDPHNWIYDHLDDIIAAIEKSAVK